MNRYKSSSQLKSLAKEQLMGKYSTVIGAFVLMQLIMTMLSWLPVLLVDTSTLYGLIIDYLISFLISVFGGIFAVGQTYIYLNISCRHGCKASDIFYGFKQHTDKALLLQLVSSAITSGSLLPAYILLLISNYTTNTMLIFPSCILTIIGSVISLYFTLAFSQAFYLLLDFPDYSVKQLLSLSVSIMKGHKARLFYIIVSFLPVLLLGILSCGIGMFWITPYINATLTNFYLDLIKNRQP